MKVTRGFKEPDHAGRTVTEARRLFDLERGPRGLPPLVVVIAALDEADSLPEVLAECPRSVAGVPTAVLVVDDGSSDATSAVARSHGAAVLRLARNCGHGVALRAGYRVAWEHGARYVATLDADGQWDPADLPAMVRLVASGRADMVIGSRTLGSTLDDNAMRTLGVPVFASLARALTGTRVTDTSSGLRVMTTELLRNVPQTQPQYQTSELVVGAALAGYRIAEVPTVMRPRLHGSSKKGRNLAYGLRYARVMLGTWWREAHRLEAGAARSRIRSGRRDIAARPPSRRPHPHWAVGALEAAVSSVARGLLRVSEVSASAARRRRTEAPMVVLDVEPPRVGYGTGSDDDPVAVAAVAGAAGGSQGYSYSSKTGEQRP